jgi:outer membrane protein assembly factor BamB
MSRNIEHLFRAPYAAPNGLQSTPEGLWIADQVTDRVALVDPHDLVDYYRLAKLIRDIPSDCSNTSGLTYGDGALWLAANGSAHLFRPERPADAKPSLGEILKVDPATGQTLARYPLPGGGGTHGVEYDRYEAGILWVTTLKDQTLTKMKLADWSVQQVIPLPYKRAHGVVRVEDGVWVVHTGDRLLVKLDLGDGRELDRIEVPPPYAEPHGLSIFGNDLIYCDAASGWVAKITL